MWHEDVQTLMMGSTAAPLHVVASGWPVCVCVNTSHALLNVA